jgi:hypothetical protein
MGFSAKYSNIESQPGVLHQPDEQEEFCHVHGLLFDGMRECHDVQLELHQFIEKHLEDVAAGRCIHVTNGNLMLLEDIEPKLNRVFKDFFVKGRTVLYQLFGQKPYKGQIQRSVTEVLLGHDLGFIQVEDDAKFEKRAQEFLQKIPGEAAKGLIAMLRGDRQTWCSGLIAIRNIVIHNLACPKLKMTYVLVDGKPRDAFPTVHKINLQKFIHLFWNNLCDSVEETDHWLLECEAISVVCIRSCG